MRKVLVCALLVMAGRAGAQEDKAAAAQKAINDTKIATCAKLKAYFEKQEKACPDQAAAARAIECKTAEDGDKMIGLNGDCAKVLAAAAGAPRAPGPNTDRCQALAEDGTVIAEATDPDAAKCREAVKAQVIAKKCDGTVKQVKIQHRRGERKPYAGLVFCPRK